MSSVITSVLSYIDALIDIYWRVGLWMVAYILVLPRKGEVPLHSYCNFLWNYIPLEL